MSSLNSSTLWTFFLFGSVLITTGLGWGSSDKVKLTDVNVITLHQGEMTNSRRTHPVRQLQCVGGSAGCSAFIPKVVQCYNRGSDGHDVQWECKTDMDSQYRFGEIAVNCEGYNYPDDPYILKGSCGLEYTIDVVDSRHHDSYYDSGHRDRDHHGHNYRKRHFGGSWLGSIIMWGVIAVIAYYVYQQLAGTPTTHTPSGHAQSANPPPPGFRSEYIPGEQASSYANTAGTGTGGGFWSGAATGGLLGYLFGSSRHNSAYYNDYGYHNGHGYYGRRYHQPRTGWGFGGSNWVGSNNSWYSPGWSSGSSHSPSPSRPSPSPPSTRTASGFGGTKRR